ncbi:MAG: hypothetical protein DLM73_01680 [Chthoniobacterales bacterium]|nr:MAG: hypothetical protein DLM73_01680 [Chthoniobacterales bacterium]
MGVGPYRKSVIDARGNTSSADMEWNANAVVRITHADNSTVTFTYTDSANPYYLASRTNERGYTTYFDRDGNNRIWQTRYPDGGIEQFSYNGFGQVVTHLMTSGGTETFGYDGRGLKTSSTDPFGNVTQYHYYSGGAWADRLQNVVDPNGNATWYEYNGRGEVTKVTHQDGTYVQSSYNPDGTLATSTDELGHTTNYTYDEYKRVLTVTNPLNETTTNSYALDWANPLLHTTNSIKFTTSPMNKNVVFDYDANFRKIDQVAALGTADEAWTFFEYDAVGNLTKTTDARWNATNFGYDNRNRQTSVTNALNQTTYTGYDGVGNKTSEMRPDYTSRSWVYDSMNRLIDHYGFAGEHVAHYDHDPAGNVTQIIDAKGASYSFSYDALNRKTSETYPYDATGAARTELFWYDAVGNLSQYKNPADQYKYFSYDSRHRERDTWWNGGGQWITKNYDAASRVTSVTTNNGETTVGYGYDDANRQLWEDQTVAGYATHRIQHDRDADGNATNTYIPGYFLLWYTYTQRNQLSQIQDGGHTPWFTFTYDAAGNMTKRQAVYGGVNDSMNCPSAQYDPLNRPTMWENTGAADTAFARSWYQYDNVNREVATWRDEQSGKGEAFGYDAMNQLTSVSYNADQVSTGTPVNATRTVSYNVTPLNRQSVTDSIEGVQTYTPNALNQYENIGGAVNSYDGNFNLTVLGGSSFYYDSASHLVSANSGEDSAQFVYDGLGRCLKRTVNWETTLIAYDGWKPIVEWDEWGYLKAWNIYGPGPDEILWRYSDRYGHLRYHLDRNGNVAFLLDLNGTVREKYTYDAFGRPTVSDWDGENARSWSWYGNRFMFSGREWIPELGIYDYRNRMYHPGLGRFLQTDPVGFDAGDMNLFRYCADDPVDRSDPTGLEGEEYNFEYASSVARTQAMAAQFAPDVKSVSVHIKPDSSSATGRTLTYVPSKMVAVLRNSSGRGYEVSKPMDGKPVLTGYVGGKPQFFEQEGGSLTADQAHRAANLVHIHNNKNTGIARAGNSRYDNELYKQGVTMERMDASDRTKWDRREPTANGGYKDSVIPAGGTSTGSASGAPSAKDIDMAHQATGVPSLGAESVNYVNGRL